MTTYIIRRLLLGIVTLVVVSILIFCLMRLLPGDPVVLYVGPDANLLSEEQLDVIRDRYHLNEPLAMQYFHWVGGIARGDLGQSIIYQQDVTSMVAQALPITLNIGLVALFIASVFGITFGVICAIRRGNGLDTLFSVSANLGITLPSFWVGILLIYVLGLKLDLLPTYGYISPFKDFWAHIQMMIMPVFCSSVFPIAILTRQTRSSMLEVVKQDYVRTAWAKGLRESVIVFRHVLKNGLIPVVTILGMHIGFMFGGAVLIESVFSIPGMGRMLRDGIMSMDYQVVQGSVLVIATIIVLVNIMVDITYGWIDPRIHYD